MPDDEAVPSGIQRRTQAKKTLDTQAGDAARFARAHAVWEFRRSWSIKELAECQSRSSSASGFQRPASRRHAKETELYFDTSAGDRRFGFRIQLHILDERLAKLTVLKDAGDQFRKVALTLPGAAACTQPVC